MDNEHRSPGSVTVLLRAWAAGEEDAYSRLWNRIYETVRQLAHRGFWQERDRRILQPTVLVHEAYLELSREEDLDLRDRNDLWRFLTKVMANYRIDEARKRLAAKRGGNLVRVDLTDEIRAAEANLEHIIAVHEALEHLEAEHPRAATALRLSQLAGFTELEIAENLGVCDRTVRTYLKFATARVGTDLGAPSERR